MIKCDFCSLELEPAQAFRIKAKSFEHLGALSMGDWAACQPCNNMIRDDDWEALINRSADAFFEHPLAALYFSRTDMLGYLKALHQKFKANRIYDV